MHVVPEGAASVTEGRTDAESGGLFSFVAFRLAKKLNILDDKSMRLLLTCVILTMVTAPFLEEMGGDITKKLE